MRIAGEPIKTYVFSMFSRKGVKVNLFQGVVGMQFVGNDLSLSFYFLKRRRDRLLDFFVGFIFWRFGQVRPGVLGTPGVLLEFQKYAS